ncbi:MAG: 30S ribosomal protein S5 [Candidatus Kaiserbacteria bacterium]|nr:30S ribosomal protein S5 [Candidatus Kaiserbacteria bacterium]
MTEEETKQQKQGEERNQGDAKPEMRGQRNGRGNDGGRGRKSRPSPFSRSKRRERVKSEFESRVLSVRRVSRVVAGGRRFSLSVAVAVGNEKGKVGIGTGNGPDMATAIEKARYQAQRWVVDVPLTEEKGIPSEASGKYCASLVHLRPAKGFVAGGAVRTVVELAGIQKINAKIHSRSKNHLNNARATIRAFTTMRS